MLASYKRIKDGITNNLYKDDMLKFKWHLQDATESLFYWCEEESFNALCEYEGISFESLSKDDMYSIVEKISYLMSPLSKEEFLDNVESKFYKSDFALMFHLLYTLKCHKPTLGALPLSRHFNIISDKFTNTDLVKDQSIEAINYTFDLIQS